MKRKTDILLPLFRQYKTYFSFSHFPKPGNFILRYSSFWLGYFNCPLFLRNSLFRVSSIIMPSRNPSWTTSDCAIFLQLIFFSYLKCVVLTTLPHQDWLGQGDPQVRQGQGPCSCVFCISNDKNPDSQQRSNI